MEQQQTQHERVEKVEATPTGTHTDKNTGMAVVAYILFFVPLLTDSKNDPFVLYHVRQGFVLFVSFIIAGVLSWVLMLIGMLTQLALVVIAVTGIMHALAGEEKPLPLIGQFADKAPF